MGGALVQQPINLDTGHRFVLKVQPARASSGLGRSKGGTAQAPLWSLSDSINMLWEYNTADLELIFNLVEEAIHSARSTNGSREERTDAAMAVLEEMAAAHGIGNIAFGGNRVESQPESQGFAAQEGGFSSSQESFASASGGFAATAQSSYAATEKSQFSADSGTQFRTQSQSAFPQASASPQEGAAPASPSSAGMQMSGSLSELGVCDIFQSISVAKMTGRLDITSGLESLEIYFEDGAPRRASFRTDTLTGEPRDITGRGASRRHDLEKRLLPI